MGNSTSVVEGSGAAHQPSTVLQPTPPPQRREQTPKSTPPPQEAHQASSAQRQATPPPPPERGAQVRSINLFKGTSVGRWRKGALVGKGASGAVFEAIDEATGGIFCVKEVEFAEDFADNPADLQRFSALRAEVELLKELQHPNCVRFLGIDRIGFIMYIQMEYVYGGNVQEIIRNFGALSDETAMKFTRQIVEGLYYLHTKNIIHRDIKGANILVGVDGVIKLADFGAAKRVQDPEQLFNTLAGTPYWMAPEVVRQEGHNKPADIWSLGGTVLQMVTGLAPYQHLPPVPALFKIGHSNDSPVAANIRASPEVVHFIRRCLDRDLTTRATIEELRNHPWINPGAQLNSPLRALSSPQLLPEGSPTAPQRATEAALARRASLKACQAQGEEESQIREFVAYLTAAHPTAAAAAAVAVAAAASPAGSPVGLPQSKEAQPTVPSQPSFATTEEESDPAGHEDREPLHETSDDMAGDVASIDEKDDEEQMRFDDIVESLGRK
jgi:serine/threonine protein kinase